MLDVKVLRDQFLCCLHGQNGSPRERSKTVANTSYVGLFRAVSKGDWQVKFPDLPGCRARAGSFPQALEAARGAVADYLRELDGPAPRPRSAAEIMIDGQRDWLLCRDFVDAVIYPIELPDEDLAPVELVAMRSRSGAAQPSPAG
jgi:predicted RNase H-like HicB family nuclease